MALRILDKKALREKGITYSNVHLLRLEADGKFPRRFRFGENRVAWLEEDIDHWIHDRVAASSAPLTDMQPALGRGDATPLLDGGHGPAAMPLLDDVEVQVAQSELTTAKRGTDVGEMPRQCAVPARRHRLGRALGPC